MNRAADPAAYYGHPRREMRGFIPASASTILDIGCGAGAFAAGLKETRKDLVIWGVEYDPAAAERAREVLDQVHLGDARQIVPTLPRARFDCICLNDILEHLLEPEDLLRDIRPLLSPRGCVVASLPNVRYFWNLVNLALKGRWEYTDEGICDRTHLRFFTRSSMRSMFRRAGYTVQTCAGINPTGAASFKLFNLLTLGRLAEMRYLQFALVAQPGSGMSAAHKKADPSP